jgi:hypothetical protein
MLARRARDQQTAIVGAQIDRGIGLTVERHRAIPARGIAPAPVATARLLPLSPRQRREGAPRLRRARLQAVLPSGWRDRPWPDLSRRHGRMGRWRMGLGSLAARAAGLARLAPLALAMGRAASLASGALGIGPGLPVSRLPMGCRSMNCLSMPARLRPFRRGARGRSVAGCGGGRLRTGRGRVRRGRPGPALPVPSAGSRPPPLAGGWIPP